MTRINGFSGKTAMIDRARQSKGVTRVPKRLLSQVMARQEGSVKLSTLAAISLPSLGALLGVSIQSYVNKSNLIQAQDADTYSLWHYLARPETTLDYVSIISAGLIGGLVGYAAYRAPAFFRGNGE